MKMLTFLTCSFMPTRFCLPHIHYRSRQTNRRDNGSTDPFEILNVKYRFTTRYRLRYNFQQTKFCNRDGMRFNRQTFCSFCVLRSNSIYNVPTTLLPVNTVKESSKDNKGNVICFTLNEITILVLD